jgi:hypothetical protein
VDSLWTKVRGCFNTDDGSLPGIEISKLSPAGVSAIYQMLRRRSRLCGDPPEFWSRTKEASVLVDSVPDAAALVVAGEAEAFHHCIEGMVSGGVELPVLGVFVWPDIVELDYRMAMNGARLKSPDSLSCFVTVASLVLVRSSCPRISRGRRTRIGFFRRGRRTKRLPAKTTAEADRAAILVFRTSTSLQAAPAD